MKDIDDLRQQGNPRKKRDRLPGQLLRPPLAVEVLVETVNTLCDTFRKPELASDLGAALTTCRN